MGRPIGLIKGPEPSSVSAWSVLYERLKVPWPALMSARRGKGIVTNKVDSSSYRGQKRSRAESRFSRADFHSAARRGPQIPLAVCLLIRHARGHRTTTRRYDSAARRRASCRATPRSGSPPRPSVAGPTAIAATMATAQSGRGSSRRRQARRASARRPRARRSPSSEV